MDSDNVCPKCNGTGRVKNSNGSISTCLDCLNEGRLDIHSKEVKDSGIQV